MMSICSWEHPRTLSSLPVMAYEECGFEDNSKQSRWQTTPRTAITAENRSNAILASFSLFSFSMLPVIILRILVFQCEDRHIFLHLQRFGATTDEIPRRSWRCLRYLDALPGGSLQGIYSDAAQHGRTAVGLSSFCSCESKLSAEQNEKQPGAFALGCIFLSLRRGRDSNSWYGMTRTSV